MVIRLGEKVDTQNKECEEGKTTAEEQKTLETNLASFVNWQNCFK